MKELKFAVGVFFNLCLKNGIKKKKKEMDESCLFSNGGEKENEVEDSGGGVGFWR